MLGELHNNYYYYSLLLSSLLLRACQTKLNFLSTLSASALLACFCATLVDHSNVSAGKLRDLPS